MLFIHKFIGRIESLLLEICVVSVLDKLKKIVEVIYRRSTYPPADLSSAVLYENSFGSPIDCSIQTNVGDANNNFLIDSNRENHLLYLN